MFPSIALVTSSPKGGEPGLNCVMLMLGVNIAHCEYDKADARMQKEKSRALNFFIT